ncbi:hypothetical protein TNCV_2624601 [Trichonephila clavipes]|nr:hypothetical protein TNCV_2624601 [Trichonephila clavipes]
MIFTGQDMTAAHLDECSELNDLNCIEIARSEIEKNLTTLFKNNNVPKKVTWDKITAVNSEGEDKTYYTPLHKWGTENKSEGRKPDE